MARLNNAGAPRWDLDAAYEEERIAYPFDRGITFGDTDLSTEAGKGWRLIGEGKRTGELFATSGQLRSLYQAARTGDTVIVIYGDPEGNVSASGEKYPRVDAYTELDWEYRWMWEPSMYAVEINLAGLAAFQRRWFDTVEAAEPRPALASPFKITRIPQAPPLPLPILNNG